MACLLSNLLPLLPLWTVPPLLAELRPAVVAEYERALHAIFTAGAEKRRRLRDAAAAALDAAHERLQLHSHGAELFAGDEATLAVLQRHLLRGVGAECADALLRYLAADAVAAGGEGEEAGGDAALSDAAAGPLSAAQRASILKQLQPDVKPTVSTAVDKLSGSSLEVRSPCLVCLLRGAAGQRRPVALPLKASTFVRHPAAPPRHAQATLPSCPRLHLRPQAFQSELDAAVEAAGLRLRRLDKKAERALVFAQRKLWEQQAAAETDASTLLALAVPLLLARQHGRVVSLPGRALAPAVELLRAGGHLPEASCQLLADFHAAVVEQLKLAGGGSEEARGEVEERLERLAPGVRALAAADGGASGGDA